MEVLSQNSIKVKADSYIILARITGVIFSSPFFSSMKPDGVLNMCDRGDKREKLTKNEPKNSHVMF